MLTAEYAFTIGTGINAHYLVPITWTPPPAIRYILIRVIQLSLKG